MKKLIKLLFVMLLASPVYAQHVYQIRADSVRIYNVCDTAELIIENRTRGVNGFLYNKGNGRTEFRRIRLENIGGSQIAISGQDTLDISTLSGIGGIDTVYRSGDNIMYVKKGIPYTVYAPLPANETLQSVTSRGSSTTHNIQFNSASGNPSNGLVWSYNTDAWKIFAESAQDTPAGNLIFESADNGLEGWIFRSNAPNEQGVTDVLSLGRDRFNYKGGAVWHAENHVAGAAFSPVLTGANVPAGFSSNASGHVTGFTTRALTPADIGAAPSGIPLQTVLSNGNTATHNITLGANGNANQYIYRAVRKVDETDYTGTLGVAGGGHPGASLASSDGSGTNSKVFYLPYNAMAPRYSPNGGVSTYEMWHSSNHAAGGAFNPDLSGAKVLQGIQSNASGHIVGINTRTLTMDDLSGVSRVASTTNPPSISAYTADLNSITNTAIIHIGTAANRPTSNPGFLSAAGNNTGNTQAKFQIFQDYVTEDNLWYRRGANTASWGAWYQVASRSWANSTFSPLTGSGNYIQNQISSAQAANAWITGGLRANSNLGVWRDGNNGIANGLELRNAAGTRGAIFQLNGEATPGLSTWIHNGSSWVKRQEYFADGNVAHYGGELYIKSGSNVNSAVHNGIKFGTDNDAAFSAIRAYRGTTSTRTGLSFFTANAEAPAEVMRITEAGNIMIGSTADNGQKLQVNGGVFVSGTMYSNALEGIRLINNGSNIAFYNTGNTARSGFIQINADAPARIYTDVSQPIQVLPGGGTPAATFNVNKSLTLGSIPASGSAATSFLTHVGGNIQSRTAAQVLSDIGAAPLSGSSAYVNNSFSAAQTANAWISGIFRSNNQFENNSGPANGGYHLRNASGALRWIIRGMTNETGSSNIGYDFVINRRADDGSSLADALTIYRSTGAVYIPGTLRMANGSFTVGTGTTTNQSFVQFMQSDQVTRDGYVGNAGGTGRNISLLSDNGSVNISATSGSSNINLNASGYISLTNGSKNTLAYSTAGVNPPALTNRSTGTKIVLYPSLSTTAADYGIGMETGNMWHAVPQNNATYGFKWYGGTTEVARLDGAGNLDARGLLTLGATGSERLSARFNAIGFNRNANNGSIYSNTGHAYQFTHTASTTATSDVLDLQVYNPSGAGVAAKALSVNGAGNISMSGTLTVAGNVTSSGQMLATSFYQSSLRSLKQNILPFSASALAILKEAQVRTFRFKADTTGKTNIGFIADEVPEEISIPGRTGVDQASTVALLVKSVQELSEENETLKEEMKALKAYVQKLLEERK